MGTKFCSQRASQIDMKIISQRSLSCPSKTESLAESSDRDEHIMSENNDEPTEPEEECPVYGWDPIGEPPEPAQNLGIGEESSECHEPDGHEAIEPKGTCRRA